MLGELQKRRVQLAQYSLPVVAAFGALVVLLFVLLTTAGQEFLNDFVSRSQNFFDAAMKYPFVQRAAITSVVVGTILAVVGVFVLLRGLVFLAEAIAHSAFAGAVVGILLGVSPLYAIIVFSVLSAMGIGWVNEKELMKNDVIIGIVFSFFMAFAIMLISLLNYYSVEVNSILFGKVLLVATEDMYVMIVVGILVLVSIFMIKKELYFMTFDNLMAGISGIPVRVLNFFFLVLTALAISVSLRSIGAILVFAMVVTPAAAAYQWTYKLNKLIILSVVFGNIATLVGLFFSYIYDLPSGSTVVIVITAIFIISFVYSPKRRPLKSFLECPYCGESIKKIQECVDCGFKEVNPDIPHAHKDEGVLVEIMVDNLPEPGTKEGMKHDHE